MRSEPSSTKSTVKLNKIKLAVFAVIILAAAVACIFAFAGNKPETLSKTGEDAAPRMKRHFTSAMKATVFMLTATLSQRSHPKPSQ